MVFPTNVDMTWVNPGAVSLDAGELRRADAAMFAGEGSALGVSGGIARHGDTSLAVTVDGSDVVTVQAGAVAIPGNAVTGTGVYRSALPSAVTGSLTARNATNARIDLVVFRAMDTDVVGTHAAYTGRIEIIAGTPSGSPVAPTLPTMAVELGRITVPATGGGAASVNATFRTYATAAGAEIVRHTYTRLPATAALYQRALVLDTGAGYTFNGSAWALSGPFATAAGASTVTGSGIASGGTATVDVTFPAGRFSVAPKVFAQLAGFVSGSGFAIMRQVDNITTSGCRIVVSNVGPATISFTALPVSWSAVQMLANSAAG